uniref:InlB B-repeat-containing protein n=1 Tax=Treponema sp. TaxID=166 RepID=UPI00258049AD
MKKHFLFLSALALFLSSCEIFSSLSEKTGAISIKMPEGSERIAETYDVNEITSFTAELYDLGSSPVAKVSSAPGKSITFESLTPGSYAIVIKAFKSTECAAYAEKSGIVVEAGATTYETVTLFKNIIKNIESVEIAKESLDKITKNYTVGQTFALPDNVSIIAHFIHGYEKELEPDDYEIYICNAEQFAESSLVKDLTLSAKARFAAVGICTESGHKKYSEPVSLVMNAEEPVVTWTIPVVKDNEISFKISASASGEISYTWEKAKTADMAGKTACTSEIEIASDGTVSLPLKDASGNYIYYLCTVTNKNIVVNGATTASRQTDVFGGQIVSFDARYTGEYEVSGQLDNITAFEITEKYADGYVLNIQSLPVNYKIAYAENLSNPEQLVGNIPLVITNLAAFDADGKNLTYEVTVPFKYSFAEDDLAFEITADGGKQENETITIAQYSGIITLSASNSLPAYMLYDGENNASTAIENTVSYAWYNSSSETIDSKIGNLENDATYYCEQTITSSEPEWYVSSEPVKKSIEIKTEPWIIEVRKSEDDGTVEGSLDAGEYTLFCTNSCASKNETIVYSINPEGIVTLDENNGFTVNQQSNEVTIKISLSIDGKVVATKEYTIPKQGTYIVTFETNGGSAVASQTIVDNGTATTPTEPTKEGYTFAGWYTDAGCTNSYDFLAAVTESITLYAKW